jgi:hypothetical protein
MFANLGTKLDTFHIQHCTRLSEAYISHNSTAVVSNSNRSSQPTPAHLSHNLTTNSDQQPARLHMEQQASTAESSASKYLKYGDLSKLRNKCANNRLSAILNEMLLFPSLTLTKLCYKCANNWMSAILNEMLIFPSLTLTKLRNKYANNRMSTTLNEMLIYP